MCVYHLLRSVLETACHKKGYIKDGIIKIWKYHKKSVADVNTTTIKFTVVAAISGNLQILQCYIYFLNN